MIEVGSYCCSWVERPLPSSNTNPLLGGGLSLLGLGDRRNELGAAPSLDDLLRGLPGLIQFPMPPGVVRRIQNWVIEERVRHNRRPPDRTGLRHSPLFQDERLASSLRHLANSRPSCNGVREAQE